MHASLPRGRSALNPRRGRAPLKITFDIDCTPEEARRFMGLPDLTPVHETYVSALVAAMEGRVKPEMLEGLVKSWMPMGEVGLGFWRRLMEAAPGASGAKTPADG
jgi:hypothetical protein